MLESIKLYRKWWGTWKTLPVRSWVKAAALYRAGEFQAASEQYLKGLRNHRRHPAYICARLDLAFCYFKMGKIRDAEDELKYVLTHAPQSREAYLRLADLQMWSGQSLDAAWTMRRAIRNLGPDQEIVASFMLAVLDNGGPAYLLKEAVNASQRLDKSSSSSPRLDVARVRLMISRGDVEQGRAELANLASQPQTTLEAIVAFAEVLLREGKISQGRQQLKRALGAASDNPRVLSLLARSYLVSGAFYNPEYAVQLATSGCQHSQWLSPREMHVLAEAHYHNGDKMAALLIASRAKDAGSKLLGAYSETRVLDELIQSLSTGTQA